MTSPNTSKGLVPILVALISAAAVVIVGYWQFYPKDKAQDFIGRVVNTEDETAVRNAKVTLESEGSPPIIYTDTEGSFSFPLNSSNSSIRVRVEAEGYKNFDRIISPSSNVRVEEIKLVPLSTEADSTPPIVDLSLDNGTEVANLSGMWVAEGYTCPASIAVPSEEVKINHTGTTLEAIKTKGDDCVRSGEITFKGRYDGTIPSTFPIQLQVASSPNITDRQSVEALLEIKDSDLLEVVYGGVKITFTRKP